MLVWSMGRGKSRAERKTQKEICRKTRHPPFGSKDWYLERRLGYNTINRHSSACFDIQWRYSSQHLLPHAHTSLAYLPLGSGGEDSGWIPPHLHSALINNQDSIIQPIGSCIQCQPTRTRCSSQHSSSDSHDETAFESVLKYSQKISRSCDHIIM